jgi:hypothetical protein
MEELELQTGVLGLERADAETALIFGAADHVPSHKALGARDAVHDVPEEGTLELVQRSEEPSGELHSSHSVGGESIEHGVDEDQPPTWRQEQGTPSREIPVDLRDERRERRETEFLRRERQAQISLGEPLDAALEGLLNVVDGIVADVHGDDGALVVVDPQPGGKLELLEKEPQAPSGRAISAHNDERVVRVLENRAGRSVE